MQTLHNKQYYQIASHPSILYDKEERVGKRQTEEYFHNSYEIFAGHLERFRNMKRGLTEEEEKEMRFMLEALISAKNILEETKNY